ncbi:MAG: 7-cyano-7-deazaguanine synthase [Elusimicrobia bacterium]|nr:7-cyano-7-deazaguanine synthase [Elusimicrobiota bacterium]
MRHDKVLVLASGGLDSAALLGWALKRYRKVQPVYCRFGLRWERAELHWLKRFLAAVGCPALQPLAVLDLPAKTLYAGHWSLTGKGVPGYRSRNEAVYLPGRNALLLSQAAVFGAQRRTTEILVGTLAGNPFRDATPIFFKSLARSLTLALGQPVIIRAPFQKMGKEAVLRAAGDLPLHLAFSCLNPRGIRPCGACNKCAERDQGTEALAQKTRDLREI